MKRNRYPSVLCCCFALLFLHCDEPRTRGAWCLAVSMLHQKKCTTHFSVVHQYTCATCRFCSALCMTLSPLVPSSFFEHDADRTLFRSSVEAMLDLAAYAVSPNNATSSGSSSTSVWMYDSMSDSISASDSSSYTHGSATFWEQHWLFITLYIVGVFGTVLILYGLAVLCQYWRRRCYHRHPTTETMFDAIFSPICMRCPILQLHRRPPANTYIAMDNTTSNNRALAQIEYDARQCEPLCITEEEVQGSIPDRPWINDADVQTQSPSSSSTSVASSTVGVYPRVQSTGTSFVTAMQSNTRAPDPSCFVIDESTSSDSDPDDEYPSSGAAPPLHVGDERTPLRE